MKILIIKLGAKGDVVRTLSILPALKEKYPSSEITWITKQNIKDLFDNNPIITRVLTIPCNVKEEFDILYNFDIDKEATDLAEKIKAKKKLGFYMQDSFPAAFNFPAEYYLNTLFDDVLKKTNKKTYQQIMFDTAELTWKKQNGLIYPTEKEKQSALNFAKANSIDIKKLIGIHLGAGPRWPSKAWHEEELKKFIILAKSKGYEILLFGGPDELERYGSFVKELVKLKIKIFQNNPNNTNREFFSLVNLCSKMICSDSFALHVSLALNKPTVGLFFCTSPEEIEDYNLLKKLVSPRLYEFFPEKMDQYDEDLTKSITAKQVMQAIEKN